MNKFYNFTKTGNNNNLYVYGAIIDGANKLDETDVTFKDFQDKLGSMKKGEILNMYVNSPGGSVFTTQAITSMIRRAKDNGVTVNAYLDGLGASCGSWLLCIADNVYIYPQSVMMIHKPMCGVQGNADEMKQQISILDKIENDVIIPLYLEKAKEGVTSKKLQDLMSKESWFTANEIVNLFDFTLLNEDKSITCSVDKDIFKNYCNIPSQIKNLVEEGEDMSNPEVKDEEKVPVVEENEAKVEENKGEDNIGEEPKIEEPKVEDKKNSVEPEEGEKSLEEGEIEDKKKKKCKNEAEIKAENAELKTELEKTNSLVVELSNQIKAMQPIVDKYEKEEAERLEKEKAEAKEKKVNYYRNTFISLNAMEKFESEEVKNLLENCVEDEKSASKLNSMIVELVANSVIKKEKNTKEENPKKHINSSVKFDNLVPDDSVSKKYGFK